MVGTAGQGWAGELPFWQRGQRLHALARRVGKDGRRSLPSGPPYFSAVAMALRRCCQAGDGGLCLSPLGSLQVGRSPGYIKPCSFTQPHQGRMGSLQQNTATGGFAGFICAACSFLQPGELNSEQLKRRWVVAEHHGMQDFGVSRCWGGHLYPSWTRRAAPSFLAGLSDQPTAALTPSHGPGWGWKSHVRAGCCGGRAAAQSPLAARELGARGVGESEGVHGAAAPLRCWRQGTGDAHVCLHLGSREERKGKHLPGRAGGSRTCFGGPDSRERDSCNAQLVFALLRTTGHKLVPLSVNQPQPAQRALYAAALRR